MKLNLLVILVLLLVVLGCAQTPTPTSTPESESTPTLPPTPDSTTVPTPPSKPTQVPAQEHTRTPDSTTKYVQGNTGYLDLRQKDPDTWEVVEGGASGNMTYDISGPTFNFEFFGKGLETDTAYSLIYYAVTEIGHINLLSDIPGVLIVQGKSDSHGNIQLKASVNLNMDLPHPGDANYDYSECCHEYGAQHGAKIWLVPSECYNSTSMIIEGNQWQPDRFLFETELIAYDDTNA